MKNQIFLILSFMFTISIVNAKEVKANPLFTESEITKIKTILSKENLLSTSKEKGVDAANEIYFKEVSKFAAKAKPLPSGKNGNKLTSNSDKDLLIYIVSITQFFSEKIDGGLIHYYGFGKLNESMPADLEWAIERSNLSKSDKELMLESLQNNNQ